MAARGFWRATSGAVSLWLAGCAGAPGVGRPGDRPAVGAVTRLGAGGSVALRMPVASGPAPVPTGSPRGEVSRPGAVRGVVAVPASWLPAEAANPGGAVVDGGAVIGQHGGAVLSQHGGSVIGQHGGAVIGQNGGAVIGQHGGAVIGQHGGAVIGQNGGAVIGQHGGAVIGQNGGAVIGQNGGAVIGQHGGGLGGGAPARWGQVRLSGVRVRLRDAAGEPVRGPHGEVIEALTDAAGAFELPPHAWSGQGVLEVQAPALGGSLLALASQGRAEAVQVDVFSTLVLQEVLDGLVVGQQGVLDRLTASLAEAAEARLVEAVPPAELGALGRQGLRPEVLRGIVREAILGSVAVSDAFEAVSAALVVAGTQREGDGEVARTFALGEVAGLLPDGEATWLFSRSRHALWRLEAAGTLRTVVPSGGWGYPEGGAAAPAFPTVAGMARWGGGVVLADPLHHRVVRVADAQVQVLAGTGLAGRAALPARAVEAMLTYPSGLAVLPDGRLAIAEAGQDRVLALGLDGRLEQLLGGGEAIAASEPVASDAVALSVPLGLAAEATALWVVDHGHGRLRRCRLLDGTVEDVKLERALRGPLAVGLAPEGPLVLEQQAGGLTAFSGARAGRRLGLPDEGPLAWGAALGWDGRRGLVATEEGRIIAFDPGLASPRVVAGDPEARGWARFVGATRMAPLPDGRVVVADHAARRLYLVDEGGAVSVAAGSGEEGFLRDGQYAWRTPLGPPTAIVPHPAGGVAFAVAGAFPCLKWLDADRRLTTLVGDGRPGYGGRGEGAAAAVSLASPRELGFLPDGRLVWYDDGLARVLTLGADGQVRAHEAWADLRSPRGLRAAGPGAFVCIEAGAERVVRLAGAEREVLASRAEVERWLAFGALSAVVLAPDGTLWLGGDRRVLRKAPGGELQVYAGPGGQVFAGEGGDETLRDVRDLALDAAGRLLILELDQLKRVGGAPPGP
ncbi:MAG: hypothetical protein VKQ33_03325 [Candidatus Sericytochromatia bacterium]|nr:hypothetical protein [Candidatus Sericytochromatia bacterium]